MKRLLSLIMALALALALCSWPVPAVADADPPPVPVVMRGGTLEWVTPLPQVLDALRSHKRRPSVRLVYQRGRQPRDYARATRRISRHAMVLGQPVDSTAMRRLSVEEYRARMRRYIRTLGEHVAVWEIGNELNGEWVGRPRTINRKVAAAWRVADRSGVRSAITLNYWPSRNCYAKPWEATLRFARRMPRQVREGVDYVFLSFYETACRPVARPSERRFARVYTRLGRIFPGAHLGFGEVGAQGRADGVPDPDLAEKRRIARRYYGMHDGLSRRLGDRWVGGYFWWYYRQDAVPKDRPESLWPTLERLFSAMRAG